MRRRIVVGSVFAVIATMLVACGSGGGSGEASKSATTTSRRGAASTASTSASTTSTSAAGASFRDPQGTYTITLGPGWRSVPPAFAKEVEAWAVAPQSDGFSANVNVLAQSAPGETLRAYLDRSIASGRNVMKDFTLVDSATITGAGGNELGSLEYRGRVAGHDLHFLAIVAMANDRAIVATLSTLPRDFARLRAQVEPFMRTLQAT